MKCINCGFSTPFLFFTEEVDCFYCNEHNIIDYYLCNECGMVFRILNNTIDEVMAQLGPDRTEHLYSKMTQRAAPLDEFKTMGEIIHRCLKCNSIAYEIKSNVYECSRCSFVWETI